MARNALAFVPMLLIAHAWRASGAVRAPLARSSRVLAGGRTPLAASAPSQCSLSMAATAPAAKSIAHLGSHEEHPAFELLRVDTVDEYGALCGVYRHKRTGAEVLSVIADEPNKVFGITFRTPPSDSTGVPHILEHSVLCGSRKYPTKDPFVELLKGSLQTFLNAFTYPDRTCYPVASMNLKDFYNLVNVYLDAVLHPRAVNDPLVLQQEGWHLELDDVSQPLTYKGVVYNEMKVRARGASGGRARGRVEGRPEPRPPPLHATLTTRRRSARSARVPPLYPCRASTRRPTLCSAGAVSRSSSRTRRTASTLAARPPSSRSSHSRASATSTASSTTRRTRASSSTATIRPPRASTCSTRTWPSLRPTRPTRPSAGRKGRSSRGLSSSASPPPPRRRASTW